MAKIKLELPHLMNVSIESADTIFKNPSSMFMTMTAMDFIDRGIEIDCNQKTYAAKVTCRELRNNDAIHMVNGDKTQLRFRWFDHVCLLVQSGRDVNVQQVTQILVETLLLIS